MIDSSLLGTLCFKSILPQRVIIFLLTNKGCLAALLSIRKLIKLLTGLSRERKMMVEITYLCVRIA